MKRIIALVLSLVMALSLCAPAWAVDAATMTLDKFISAVKEGKGTYDGNGVTVKWTDDSTAANYHNYDQVNNTYTGQYYDFFGDFDSFSTAVSADYPNIKIANVNFEFVPSGTVTTAEFQLYSTGNIEFVGCSFDKVSVDPWGNTWGSDNVYPESATFTNCTFKNIANRYAIHQSRAKTLIVNGCTFESCRSGIHVNPVTNLTVTNNTFTGISDGHGVLCLAEGITTTPTSVNVSGNKAEGQVMLRQLSSAVTYAQVSSILDTTKNTYGTAYVTGSTIPAGPVAKVGDVEYFTLQDAVEAVKDGGEIKLLDNVTFDENTRMSSGDPWYEGLYYTGDKSFTVDLNGKTITNDSSVNDYLLLFKNTGSKANTITFKNGTIEAASSAYCAICTATTSTQKITINLESVNLINNNSNGAAAKIRGGAEMNVKNGTVITGKDSYVGIEAVNKGTVVNIYDGAEIYQKGTSSYVGSLVGVSYNATVNVYGGYGESAKGAFIAMTSGGTINVSGGEWIANTDGTPKNDNYGVLIAQNDKTTYTNAGNSVINVTGGAFKGGYNCYGNAVGDAQINISGGYFNADPTAYCADKLTGVTSDKAGYLYMVGEKKATAAEVDVAAPVVSADKVDTTNTTVNNVVNTIGGASGVEIDNAALTAAAVGAANENKVTPTAQQAEDLNDLPNISCTTVNDVAIVVQTYFDVEIEEVKVDDTTNKTTSITVDITPMQQTVATTEDVVDSNADIEVGENAVKVGNPVPVKITEPVDITLKLPSTCFAVDDKVYITHQASVGTVIYEATVAADYTITFTTTHGFSPFTISTSDPGVKASVGTDNYADLQSAINYAGKDATIVVKASGQTAIVKGETSFIVTTEAGVSAPTISAGSGYTMTKENVTGGVKYTFTKVTGGYYPYYPPTTTPDSELVKSPDTFDAGIALYVGVSVMGAIGTVVLGKKRED